LIAHLQGKLSYVSQEAIVIEVNGVGYLVHVASATVASLPKVGSPVKLYTYLHVKESEMTLYGFTSAEQRQVFELLLSVSGVGPKMAAALVSSLPLNTLVNAILQEDAVMLTQVPGIGAKLAQRVCLELHEKIATIPWSMEDREEGGLHVNEAVEALMGLGYTHAEARRAAVAAARQLGPEAALEEVIRAALKRLG